MEQTLRIVLSAFVVVVAPLLLTLLKKNIDKIREENLREVIKVLVEAAEQLLKETDPTGEKRKQYVKDQLELLGIEYSPYIDSLIESNVLYLY